MRPAAQPLVMDEGQREILEKFGRTHSAAHREATHVKALLLAAQGMASTAIATQ